LPECTATSLELRRDTCKCENVNTQYKVLAFNYKEMHGIRALLPPYTQLARCSIFM